MTADTITANPVSRGGVHSRAQALGYIVVQLHCNPDAGYWLARSHNWISYEPGRTLDELHDQLDVIAEQQRIERLMRFANADAIRAFVAYSPS